MRKITDDEKAIIFLDGIEKLEYKYKKALFDLYSSPSEIFSDKRLIDLYFSKIGKEDTGRQIILSLKDERLVEGVVYQRRINGFAPCSYETAGRYNLATS